nr:retrovirus-related Pol polyprotein from transposon TNT 1-94 [Tanacetum cinerariifolium]
MYERTDHRTCDHAEYISTINMSHHLKSLGRMSSRPNIPRPSKCFFSPSIQCGGIDYLSNECLYYPIFQDFQDSPDDKDDTRSSHKYMNDLEKEFQARALLVKSKRFFKKAPAKGNKSSSASKVHSAPVDKLKSVKIKDDPPLDIYDIRKPIWYLNSGCLRHMTGVKGYLHKHIEQPGPKVVFGDDSTCTTEVYGSINCNGIVFIKFDEKQGIIFNSKKEFVMIAPQTSSIKKCLHLLYMDLFRPVTPRSINHEKYTLVIVDEYSREQTEETYHITFDESSKAIKFSKPSVDNINLAESERYSPDEYLYPYEPSQRNKRDETGIVIKNKARLAAQGYNQQEGINYNETFAPVANPKESHLIAVKRIFRYLKGTPSLGLWYLKCLDFDLKGYSDSDYAGCNMDKKAHQVYLLQSQKKELEQAKVIAEAEVASMKAKPSYLDINQLTKLMVTSLKPELSKLLASHDFASCLPTKLKELPSKIIGLSREIKELKQHIKDMEIELPKYLNGIPSKLETFTSTISNLTPTFATLVENTSGATTTGVPSADKATASPAKGEKDADTNLKIKLVDLLGIDIVTQHTGKMGQLKSLKNSKPMTYSWLNGERFATLVENTSGATTTGVPSADKATTSPAEGEKDANTNLKIKLVDLLGINIVTQYYNKKLLYERYYEKMKKRR